MKRLKITEGVFSSKPTGDNIDDGYDILCNESNGWGKWVADAKSPSLLDGTIEEAKANAELIADAFNTANETDQLPSEIKQDRDELLEALKNVTGQLEYMRDNHLINIDIEIGSTSMVISESQQLINKIEKK